jgi:hypothetical protein
MPTGRLHYFTLFGQSGVPSTPRETSPGPHSAMSLETPSEAWPGFDFGNPTANRDAEPAEMGLRSPQGSKIEHDERCHPAKADPYPHEKALWTLA